MALPKKTLTRAEVRELDRRASAGWGLPTLVLMENAGRAAAAVLQALGIHGPVVVACGKGNNGGDGLVLARWLTLWDFDVKVCLFAQPQDLSQDAASQWQVVEKMGLKRWVQPSLGELESLLAGADWTVDALFGVGLTGPVRPPFDQIIAALNAGSTRVLAVDIPSGLDADSGEPMGPAVRARHTVTFVAPKQGFDNPATRAWLGRVHVADIGVPLSLLTGS